MKQLIIIFLAIALLFASCGKSPSAADSDRISVVATNFPCYDFARAVVGEHADVTMLLQPGAESHSFEPTSKDIVAIQNCDVFIYVGGESDAWVEKILGSLDTSKMRIVTLIDCVDAVLEEAVEGMQADEEEEEAPEIDEHVWTSPRNAKLIVERVTAALCEADSVNSEAYRSNCEAYTVRLAALDTAFRDVVAQGSRRVIVFGDRFPFRYLTDAYGLSYYAAFPGCSSETEASSDTIRFLIDKVNSERIPAVFHIELSNSNIANTIAEATGAKVLLLHSCHNISADDFHSGIGYLELMERNVEALREALG